MKRPLNRLWCYVCVACLALCCVACSDDDDDDRGRDIPSYLTDLLWVSTNAEGNLTLVTLDNGSTYDVAAQNKMTDYADTTLRCRATYTLDKGRLTLHGLATVLCMSPVPASDFVYVKDGVPYYGSEYIPRNPVKLVSMWKSGGCINLHLGVMTTGHGVHQYAFCEDSPGHYSLVHLRPSYDAESYTSQVYMSMPIPDGVDAPTIAVYTYDGIQTRTF